MGMRIKCSRVQMRREYCTLGQSEMPSSGTQLLSVCSKIVPDVEGEIKNMTFRIHLCVYFAPARMAQLVEHQSMHREVTGSIPNQNTCPDSGLNPQ